VEQASTWIARWNALPAAARAGVASIAFAIPLVATITGIVTHAPRVALFATPLHPEQLAEVEERLAGWSVDFTPTGDNVVVPVRRRNDVLLRLSLAGVPHAHVPESGEALSGVGVLTPQTVIDAQARAGLAGDIEAGLRGIDGLDDVRVIVTPAKAAEFADEDAREPSASVRVRLRAGAQISHEAVAGIRSFVAAGVPGLQPSHVTIVDDRGVALDDRESGSDASELQRSLQSALDAAFGDGAAVVRVHAEYRNERTDERDVRRSQLGGAISRAARTDAFDDGGKRYRHHDASEERGSETREWSSRSLGGDVKRLSTAVFVDAARGLDVVKVRDLAAATVGYDAARGDALAVAAVDFHREPVARKDAWWLLYGSIVPLLPTVVIAIALLAAARAGIPPAFRLLQGMAERAAVRRTSAGVSQLPPSRVRSALAQEPPHAAAAIISALPAATAAAVLEMYPSHERDAIVRRMQRPHSPLLPDAEELLRRHA
jgi:flagellar M-ring protein FliF